MMQNLIRLYTFLILSVISFVGYSQNAFFNLGKSKAEEGSYEEAISLTKQSLELISINPNKYYLFDHYKALCEYYSYVMQPDSCQLYAQKTLELQKNIPEIDYSDVIHLLSFYYNRAGLFKQAIDYRKELTKITTEIYGNETPLLLREYRILSSFFKDAGDKQKAVEYAKMEENLAYRLKDVEYNYEYLSTYDDSFGYLLYAIQINDDPIEGIQYIINCLENHSVVINENCKTKAVNAIWAMIGENGFIDSFIDFSESKNQNTMQLPPNLCIGVIDAAPDAAEEFIQNRTWELYEKNEYDKAIVAAKLVLDLRKLVFGKKSQEYLEWIGVINYQAFKRNQIEDMVEYCKYEVDFAKDTYGLNSKEYEDAISSIRAYAHQLIYTIPQFTTEWILPYYIEIQEADILPKYQYEFEIIQLEAFLSMENLQSSDLYARKLVRWTYPSNSLNIPLEDRVRISLKLANHYLHMGDHYKSRFEVEQAWKHLEDAQIQPSMAQMIDRLIVEQQLRMDTLGRSQINADWIIETATPIIERGVEDAEILAFFYTSRSWAYEGLKKYDNAINDITKAISINPLYSRKKKLAQIYIDKKEYDLAETVLLSVYNDPNVPVIGIKSIEADLTALYWLKGDMDELSVFLSKDIRNLKSDIRNAFAFMDENEREKFLDKSLLGSTLYFDMYTSNSNGNDQWQFGNQMAYNLALVQKGLLLSTTRDIDTILQNAPDSIQSKRKEYEQLRKLFESPLFNDYGEPRERRIELMQYVVSQPQFLSQLNYTWEDVKNHLTYDEASIEFINLWSVTPENMQDTEPSLGALILRKDSECPIFVKLPEDTTITNLFEFDGEGSRLCELLYSVPLSNQLYELIWEPLMPYLNNIETVYYAPTGVLHNINLDWIGSQDTSPLSEKYNLYRMSSTREICKRKDWKQNYDATLYGDITYSIKDAPLSESVTSRYRSSTRAGFRPLKGAAEELDSITHKLDLLNIKSCDYRQEYATEETFRKLSGNSPKIIHIATHGFYYSREAIEKEFESGNFSNFIAFQGMMNPELYHSGLALSGAQDTWHNESDDISKYNNMDSNNDGILLSAEISKLDLSNTDLVILSACETALGNVKSEGVYGLQRGFKLAGVNSLIMSLWKVDDEATQILMTSFYDNYLNGMSKRESLLSAQKKVRNTPGFEDPYNWAAFILLDGLN